MNILKPQCRYVNVFAPPVMRHCECLQGHSLWSCL